MVALLPNFLSALADSSTCELPEKDKKAGPEASMADPPRTQLLNPTDPVVPQVTACNWRVEDAPGRQPV